MGSDCRPRSESNQFLVLGHSEEISILKSSAVALYQYNLWRFDSILQSQTTIYTLHSTLVHTSTVYCTVLYY